MLYFIPSRSFNKILVGCKANNSIFKLNDFTCDFFYSLICQLS